MLFDKMEFAGITFDQARNGPEEELIVNYYLLNRGDALSEALSETFHMLAGKHGLNLDEQNPGIVVSIGGDGTMLHAVHRFIEQLDQVAFVGIHTGHLGFYADWKSNEIEQVVQMMASRTELAKVTVHYPCVKLEVETTRGVQTHYALNEITIRGAESMLVARVDINDEIFEMFRGDGICISSPTGSTAYNKSLGGAIIHPSLAAIQIAEMASINNRVYRTLGSPLILPKHHHCDIYPKAGHNLLISVDHLQYETDEIRSIRCLVADKQVGFARYRPFPFWNRVKEAFVGTDQEDGSFNLPSSR